MIYVFLANGFEEIEAIATIDVLRRAELGVITVGVGSKQITGAHGLTITADKSTNITHADILISYLAFILHFMPPLKLIFSIHRVAKYPQLQRVRHN